MEDYKAEIERLKFELEVKERHLDLVTDGIWDWDLENPDYEYMSPRFWEILGYDSETMPHDPKAWQTIIHPSDAKLAKKAFDDHLSKGTPYNMVVRYTHKEGHTIWVICRGQVIRDKNGNPVRMLGCHQDITHLRANQDIADKLDEIIQRMERLAV